MNLNLTQIRETFLATSAMFLALQPVLARVAALAQPSNSTAADGQPARHGAAALAGVATER